MKSVCQISTHTKEELSQHLRALELPQCANFNQGVEQGFEIMLFAEEENISLAVSDLGEKSRLTLDFFAGALGHRRHFGGGRNQDMCRAVGLNRNSDLAIADATAGLGRDAFILASQGATVTAYEQNPILSAMLLWSRQGAQRAALEQGDPLLLEILDRLSFINTNSETSLPLGTFDVVYLDPMFPGREKSAKVKKEMQILHQLLAGEASDENTLFDSCLAAAKSRLVVKRPVKAAFFADREPSHQILGKTVRYDVYVNAALPG